MDARLKVTPTYSCADLEKNETRKDRGTHDLNCDVVTGLEDLNLATKKTTRAL
jgi:hypothetical protein